MSERAREQHRRPISLRHIYRSTGTRHGPAWTSPVFAPAGGCILHNKICCVTDALLLRPIPRSTYSLPRTVARFTLCRDQILNQAHPQVQSCSGFGTWITNSRQQRLYSGSTSPTFDTTERHLVICTFAARSCTNSTGPKSIYDSSLFWSLISRVLLGAASAKLPLQISSPLFLSLLQQASGKLQLTFGLRCSPVSRTKYFFFLPCLASPSRMHPQPATHVDQPRRQFVHMRLPLGSPC